MTLFNILLLDFMILKLKLIPYELLCNNWQTSLSSIPPSSKDGIKNQKKLVGVYTSGVNISVNVGKRKSFSELDIIGGVISKNINRANSIRLK